MVIVTIRNRTAIVYAAYILIVLLVIAPTQVSANQTTESTPASTESQLQSESEGPNFVLYPNGGTDGEYVSLDVSPGEQYEIEVVLGNADTEPVVLETYVVDAIPMTNGGFGAAEQGVNLSTIAAWIDYPVEEVRLQPQEGVIRTLNISIPEDAASGQYIAALILETAEPIEVPGTTLFNQVVRKAMPVFLTVPGNQEASFQLGNPEPTVAFGNASVMMTVSNTGNVLVKPHGELVLSNSEGVVLTAPVQMGSVYAGFEAPLIVNLGLDIPSGDYEMSISLRDNVTGENASIVNFPLTISNEEEAPDQFVLTGDVVLRPSGDAPVYSEVVVQVSNSGDSAVSAEVVLDVRKDGEVVESFTLASSLSLPVGETEVSQRYIPPAGFESGEWSFVVRLNVVDPSTGATTTVSTFEDIPEVVLP